VNELSAYEFSTYGTWHGSSILAKVPLIDQIVLSTHLIR